MPCKKDYFSKEKFTLETHEFLRADIEVIRLTEHFAVCFTTTAAYILVFSLSSTPVWLLIRSYCKAGGLDQLLRSVAKNILKCSKDLHKSVHHSHKLCSVNNIEMFLLP